MAITLRQYLNLSPGVVVAASNGLYKLEAGRYFFTEPHEDNWSEIPPHNPALLTEHRTSAIETTLTERGQRYGSFPEHARITQSIKAAMIDSPNWSKLRPEQKEALQMIAHKCGRILNGDPDYLDSWHDIVGYAKLVADTLQPTNNE